MGFINSLPIILNPLQYSLENCLPSSHRINPSKQLASNNKMSDQHESGDGQPCQTLTYQESQIAKAFLKKRFPDYALNDIITSLFISTVKGDKNYERVILEKNADNNQSYRPPFPTNNSYNSVFQNNHYGNHTYGTNPFASQNSYGSNSAYTYTPNQHGTNGYTPMGSYGPTHHPYGPVLGNNDKEEQQKVVAKIFCEHGINYNLIKYFYPKMTPKTYRSIVQMINNQTVNDIEKFLRYQCNVQIERLNRDQKRSMRTQLTKIREWLGNKDMSQLETYYKFIERHYQNKNLVIDEKDALKLYKTILQIVKSPFVNILGDSIDGDQSEQLESSQINCSREEQKAIIILYIKHKSLFKVSHLLGEKYGYNIKWSVHSLKQIFKTLIKISLKKLFMLVEKYAHLTLQLKYSYSDQNITLLLNNEDASQVKIKLFSLYLKKKINMNQIIQLAKLTNNFYASLNSTDNYQAIVDNMDVDLPKLQDDNEPKDQQIDKNIGKQEQNAAELKKKEEQSTNKHEEEGKNMNGKQTKDQVKEQQAKEIKGNKINKQVITPEVIFFDQEEIPEATEPKNNKISSQSEVL